MYDEGSARFFSCRSVSAQFFDRQNNRTFSKSHIFASYFSRKMPSKFGKTARIFPRYFCISCIFHPPKFQRYFPVSSLELLSSPLIPHTIFSKCQQPPRLSPYPIRFYCLSLFSASFPLFLFAFYFLKERLLNPIYSHTDFRSSGRQY